MMLATERVMMQPTIFVLLLLTAMCVGEMCEECEDKLENTLFKVLLDETNSEMVSQQSSALISLCRRLHVGEEEAFKECAFTLPKVWSRITKVLFQMDGIYANICNLVTNNCDDWTNWEDQGQCRKCKRTLPTLATVFGSDSSVMPWMLELLSGDSLCVPLCDPDVHRESCLERCQDFLQVHLEGTIDTLTFHVGRRAQIICSDVFQLSGC